MSKRTALRSEAENKQIEQGKVVLDHRDHGYTHIITRPLMDEIQIQFLTPGQIQAYSAPIHP